MTSHHLQYLQQRATDEREAAASAPAANIAEIHLQLAREYDALVRRAQIHFEGQPASLAS